MRSLELSFHVAVPAPKNPDKAKWSRHSVKLPRIAAVALAAFMFNYVPEDEEPPLMFAIPEDFLEKLTEGERIQIECQEDHPEIKHRLGEQDKDE